MSELEKLQSELTQIKSKIHNLKEKANEKRLPGKIRDITRLYDQQTDCSGWGYMEKYREKVLSLQCEENYVQVSFSNHDSKLEDYVFRATLLPNDVGDIYLYIPGPWETRIEELYEKLPEKEQQRRINQLDLELSSLKTMWQLEDD